MATGSIETKPSQVTVPVHGVLVLVARFIFPCRQQARARVQMFNPLKSKPSIHSGPHMSPFSGFEHHLLVQFKRETLEFEDRRVTRTRTFGIVFKKARKRRTYLCVHRTNVHPRLPLWGAHPSASVRTESAEFSEDPNGLVSKGGDEALLA